MKIGTQMKNAAKALSSSVSDLQFAEPVAFVYNPLDYAWSCHQQYLDRFANSTKRVIFLGMNPGPWGMAQTGVPFGEVHLVKNWLGISGKVEKPDVEHPKKPIQGFSSSRREVSGERFWTFFSKICKTPEVFFRNCIVYNHCPLVYMNKSGKNLTPPDLSIQARNQVLTLCDQVRP